MCLVKLFLLSGNDTEALARERAQLLQTPGVREDADCAEDGGAGAVSAVECVSMFGGSRVCAVEHFEAVSKENVERIIAAAPASDAVLVCRGDQIAPWITKALQGVAEVRRFPLAHGRDIADRVLEVAKAEGVQLGGAQRKLLVERCGENLERVRSVCWQLATIGVSNPTERQLLALIGSSDTAGVPWDVTDALDKGDTAAALQAAVGLEPLAVLSYLCNVVAQAGQVVEACCSTPADVEKLLGQKSFQARKTLDLSRRLGREGVRSAWAVLSSAEVAAKGRRGSEAALSTALYELSGVWGARS